jgi:hypothetical protein
VVGLECTQRGLICDTGQPTAKRVFENTYPEGQATPRRADDL